MTNVFDVFAALWLLILEVARVFIYGFAIACILLLIFIAIVTIYEKLKGDDNADNRL